LRKARRGRSFTVLIGVAVLALSLAVTWSWRGEIRTRVLLAQEFETLGPNAQGFREYKHRRTGILFVLLPGGTFRMGSPADFAGAERDERPQHKVTLSPFLIAKYEITRAQWNRVMDEQRADRSPEQDLPAKELSWYDCQEFCRRSGLRLPSEAQWEFACRAGTEGAYGGTGRLEDMGWCERSKQGSKPRGLQPGGQLAPNAFGLHDMHGNLWEWCEDIYDSKFYGKRQAAGRDPVCISGRNRRVRRGGCYSSPAENCRAAYRRSSDPGQRTARRGFRPAFPLG
jgi:formylglycine-generating enzyme required for sulfatase activity